MIERHEVSGTGERSVGLATTSTTSMVPRWQCGQSRKDIPVSASKSLAKIGGWIGRGWRRGPHRQQFPAERQLPGTMMIGEEAVIADALKPIRQHMDQEAADELVGLEGHRFVLVAAPVVLPAEADLAVVDGQQAAVGDGDAVGIAADILEDLFRAREGSLGVDHPVGLVDWREVAAECCGFLQVAMRREEVQPAGGKCLLEVMQEPSPEQSRQHSDRQEEARTARDPAVAVLCDAATRDQAMQMRVVHQVLPPGVEHGQEADLGAEVGRIGGDGAQRLRDGPEQNVVDHGLVLEGDGGDLLRHGEHDMEVWRVEQLRLTVVQPLSPCETLAFWTIPVAA